MSGSDVGLQAIATIFQTLQIDDQWSERRPRGFTWWSYRLAQHVDAGEPWQDDEYQLSRIRIVTEVVNNVDPKRHPAEMVAMANMRETLSAVIWDDANRSIVRACTGIVHQENVGWLSKLLAAAAVLQNTAAHSAAHALAEVVGGSPAASNHSQNGERPEADGMLDVPEQVIATAGKGKSGFSGQLCAELDGVLDQYQLLGFCDSETLTCEVPFSGFIPVAARVALGLPNIKLRTETSLLQIFADMEHPELGHGALITLRPAATYDPDQVPAVANQLNLTELNGNTRSNLLGAWCPDPTNPKRDTVAFNAFIPSVLAEPGLLENQVVFQAVRSRSYGATGGEFLRAGN